MSRVRNDKPSKGKVEILRQEEAKRIQEEQRNGNHIPEEESRTRERTEGMRANRNEWAPSDSFANDIIIDSGNWYRPLRTSTGAIVSLHPDKLRIGKLSEQKLLQSPRFNGKVLRCPGRFYVIDSETKEEVSVYPHIRVLAYFLRYKLTKYISSSSVKLSVITSFLIYLSCF